jgi:hypothetical protein
MCWFVILVLQEHRKDIRLSFWVWVYPRATSELNLLHISLSIVKYNREKYFK